MNEPEFTVDIRFALEGISVSVYTDGGAAVVDESWYTWDEVDELKGNEESDITFELGEA